MKIKDRKKRIAKAKHLKLSMKGEKFIMEGGQWGTHSLYSDGYTERINSHWQGYMGNNNVKWAGHPEYFPHIGKYV